MKTNRLIIAVTLILTGSFFMNISAQEALKAIAKKCETMENIDVSIVRSKDKKTKEPTQVVMIFRFSKNEALKKEILAAFEKDKDMADQETVQKRDGFMNISYHFGNSYFSFREDRSGNITFSSNENYTDNPLIRRPLSFIENESNLLELKIHDIIMHNELSLEQQKLINTLKDTLVKQSQESIQIINNRLSR